jgi:glutamyl-tRNA synthetase
VPFLEKLGIATEASDRLAAIVRTLQERSKTLVEMAEAAVFFFREKEIDPAAAKKVLTPDALALLDDAAAVLSGASPFTHEAIEASLAPVVAKADGKLGKIAQPIRVALTGSTVSPGVFEIMEVLGKEEVIRRLSSVRSRIPA